MNFILFFSCILIFTGCASVMDAPRNILGFSRRDVNAVREDSSFQVYKAELAEVFSAVVDESIKAEYLIFTKDEIRGFIMVMNIPKVVNTTEVGIFITPLGGDKGVKVELSSRSTPAKKIVAAAIFSKLGEKFTKI